VAKLDESKQEMLGANVVVVQTVSFLACKHENPLRTESEIIHHFRGGLSACLFIRGLGNNFNLSRMGARSEPHSSVVSFSCELF
jgi:hypothetical protein